MNRSDYAYSVAYVRAIENKLLTKSDIESLINAPSVNDALRLLSDKGYGAGISGDNFEKVLNTSFEECYREIKEIAPGDCPVDVLLYKNDFHNLKVVLKGVQLGVKDYENYCITPATIDYETLIDSIAKAQFDQLPAMLGETAAKAYEILGKTGDSQLSDLFIDKASMDFTLSQARKSKNEFLTELIKLTNTFTNIKIAARCALTQKDVSFADMALSDDSNINRKELIAAIPHGFDFVLEFLSSCGFNDEASALKISVAEYEKYADNAVIDYMKNSKYISLGIEPLIAYIYSKQNEIQSIRIIIGAKQNGIDEDKIRTRLRNF